MKDYIKNRDKVLKQNKEYWATGMGVKELQVKVRKEQLDRDLSAHRMTMFSVDNEGEGEVL